MQDGIKGILIDAEDRFQIFEELGVKMVNNVPPKSDSSEFEIAMNEFLELPDPSKICMIGDNYITDEGAIDAGMLFIYIQHDSTTPPTMLVGLRFNAFLKDCLSKCIGVVLTGKPKFTD